MKKLFKIVKDSKKSIRQSSVNISLPLSNEIIDLGKEMLEYLKLSQDDEFLKNHPNVRSGVGLAAPQIGKNIKMIAIYIEQEKKNIEYVLVNPEIIQESVQKCYLKGGEGCLSVDGDHPGNVFRSNRIKVKAFDLLLNKETTIEAHGFLAIVLQHEIDHLHGTLFYDHINIFNPFGIIEGAIAI